MTKKQFWQGASNWGLIGGAALFIMNLVAWALKLETGGNSWVYELLQFMVICPLIIFTGKRNAVIAGTEGYSYGRAVGFVLALMMFAGIVYGVGRFLMINFIAPEYYGAMNEKAVDAMLLMYSNLPQFDMLLEQKDMLLAAFSNPFYLIFGGILELVLKGGFLGLLLCGFLYTKPDIFADTTADIKHDDENRNE
jgi:hypothetical protein